MPTCISKSRCDSDRCYELHVESLVPTLNLGESDLFYQLKCISKKECNKHKIVIFKNILLIIKIFLGDWKINGLIVDQLYVCGKSIKNKDTEIITFLFFD